MPVIPLIKADLNEVCDQLVLSRQLIVDAIAQVKINIGSDKAIVEKIRNFYERASRHAFLQSESFYSNLRGLYLHNSSALKIIDFFEADLKELRLRLFIFGEHYFAETPVRHTRLLISNFGELSRDVTDRINVEDSQLFPLLGLEGKVRCQEH